MHHNPLKKDQPTPPCTWHGKTLLYHHDAKRRSQIGLPKKSEVKIFVLELT